MNKKIFENKSMLIFIALVVILIVLVVVYFKIGTTNKIIVTNNVNFISCTGTETDEFGTVKTSTYDIEYDNTGTMKKFKLTETSVYDNDSKYLGFKQNGHGKSFNDKDRTIIYTADVDVNDLESLWIKDYIDLLPSYFSCK